MIEEVILVNEEDQVLGTMEKMEAHEKALLHRAFSVFVFNDKNELMLQQRALHKYHSPGLWTNTCCSHQRMGETDEAAARRRLQEEMGFVCDVEELFSFVYKAEFENGLTEHEFDHVFVGRYDHTPSINEDEVADWRWISLEDLHKEMKDRPEDFTAWFKIIFEKYAEHIKLHKH